ncbi:hypothetical protein SDRG_14830 [Saprolegnia diclina VS20]|uniref:Uncharacterized protein n=1 Tax=Saprolegnia diclina (strain VS20) TaxID=1156394 RepID=T0PPL8_SAPDV|nr:hypothetical protein SDRG_14830 [Saprolegnia diclina VS20]EQC27389.1 hypothetical protein SDRG_14830 [Saprolegnia diclina VS20]|eukprot:XP_008619208.1 hypothetical protein SDRG_14830 [Saprolegnia diclina VS20]
MARLAVLLLLLALVAIVAAQTDPPGFNNSDIMGWLGNRKKDDDTELVWSITMRGSTLSVNTTAAQREWEKLYRINGDILRNDHTNLCLEAAYSASVLRVYGAICNASSPEQTWTFAHRRLEHAIFRRNCLAIVDGATPVVRMETCDQSAAVPSSQKIRFFR